MKVLLDENIDIEFRHCLLAHDVTHVRMLGWDSLSNGKLLSAAESEGFQAFITADQNLRFQQNIAKRNLAVFVLDIFPNKLTALMGCIPDLERLLDKPKPGQVFVIEGPHPKRER